MEKVEEQVTFKVESTVKTYRLLHPANDDREFGFAPVRLSEKTMAVTQGFYEELLKNSCHIRLKPEEALRYLWHFRKELQFSVFSQN
jgi:hypothetical protein